MRARHHGTTRKTRGGRPALLLLVALLAACSTPDPVERSIRGEDFQPSQLLQSDINRIANLSMRDNLDSLELLLEKLYRRNPSMWRRTNAASLEDARTRVMQAIRAQQPLPGLDQAHGIDAMFIALSPHFEGDRAGALIYGMGSMLVDAYGGHLELNLVNGLDAQKLANAAHNITVAAWILAQRRAPDGEPMLLSNEISAAGRNLSFEREIGKIIGRLDTLAALIDEKYRRSAISYAQGFAAGPFLQFIPLDAVGTALR